MIAKISLTAAFLLMVAPAMACGSTRDAVNPAPTALHAHESPVGIVVAQSQMGTGTADNDNDNDNDANSNDNADNDQNGDNNQFEQQNATGTGEANPQVIDPPPENESDGTPQTNKAPEQQPYQ